MKKYSFLKLPLTFALLTSVPLLIHAQETDQQKPAETETETEKVDREEMDLPSLIAVITPTEDHKTRGVVTFEPTEENKVRVTSRLTGLNPETRYAIHIHEFGDLSALDGSSAGNHFDLTPPADESSDESTDEGDHEGGEFGNLQADAEGNANQVVMVDNLSLTGHRDSIVGRAVVIYALGDEGTPSSGDAEDRVAQGIIAIANPKSIQGALVKVADDANTRTTVNASAGPGETAERVAEKFGRGAKKAARTTVNAVERGAKEVGGTVKKVGEKIEAVVD